MTPSYNFLRLSLLFFVAAAMAWGQKVTVEFDESAAFSDYKTFAIRQGQLSSKNPTLNSELVRKKIDAEIRRRLTEKGLTEVGSQPDLNVRYSLGTGARREVEAYPAGWRGLGTRYVRVRYTEGTLVLNLRDAKKQSLVWRAVATEEKNDASQISSKLSDMVKKSIDKYPPKK